MASAATRVDTADVLAVDDAIARSSGSASFGITTAGFNPKPFGRLLAEKLALARALLGDDLDLSSGSVIRKILEVSALEDARTWAALSSMYDNGFVATATGEALSRLGAELGLVRPFLQAIGHVKLKLVADLPPGVAQLDIPRGARLLTPGGHHSETDESIVLSPSQKERVVAVVAFYPGPDHNLDPAAASQTIDRYNPLDPKLEELVLAEQVAGAPLLGVEHTQPLAGGELQWPDDRYRDLLLAAPRSVWTVDAIRIAASLVPGVRQVQVRDAWGGLDIRQSIFGNFNFIERLFSEERDLASPYYFTVLVAPTAGAIWEGRDGVRAAVESAIEDLRPIGIFPEIELAELVGIGVRADVSVRGIPMTTGSKATVNASAAAAALKQRLLQRVRRYVDNLSFGEPVRTAEVMWALMNEPGVADVQNLELLRFPPSFDSVDVTASPPPTRPQAFVCGLNVVLQGNEIAEFVDDPTTLTIV
jgi:hypothetical protein